MSRRAFEIDAELGLPTAQVRIAQIYHSGSDSNLFCRENVYWVDLCLTPRRPNSSARYVDRWHPHRSREIGAMVALPPTEKLDLRSAGGRHASLICEINASVVDTHFPADFQWTDRRLEACLDITHEPLRALMLRLNQEVRNPGLAAPTLCEAMVAQLSVELARFIVAVDEPDQRGGLATWRQRIIDERIAERTAPPTVAELAALCKLSARQLNRSFKADHGCSISDYLGTVRIEAAKRRLWSRASISEIATALGYSSQSNFTSAFRRATGVTPNQFRQRVIATRTD